MHAGSDRSPEGWRPCSMYQQASPQEAFVSRHPHWKLAIMSPAEVGYLRCRKQLLDGYLDIREWSCWWS